VLSREIMRIYWNLYYLIDNSWKSKNLWYLDLSFRMNHVYFSFLYMSSSSQFVLGFLLYYYYVKIQRLRNSTVKHLIHVHCFFYVCIIHSQVQFILFLFWLHYQPISLSSKECEYICYISSLTFDLSNECWSNVWILRLQLKGFKTSQVYSLENYPKSLNTTRHITFYPRPHDNKS